MGLQIRFSTDGVLSPTGTNCETADPSDHLRLKIMAELEISQSRRNAPGRAQSAGSYKGRRSSCVVSNLCRAAGEKRWLLRPARQQQHHTAQPSMLELPTRCLAQGRALAANRSE